MSLMHKTLSCRYKEYPYTRPWMKVHLPRPAHWTSARLRRRGLEGRAAMQYSLVSTGNLDAWLLETATNTNVMLSLCSRL